MNLPLGGRRVLVTRSARQASKLSEELRALGAIPVEVPVIEIRPPSSYERLDTALRNLDRYDWLILASANAARALSERAAHLGIRLQRTTRLQVAAVGPATADEARRVGLSIALIPDSYVAEELLAALFAIEDKGSGRELSRPEGPPYINEPSSLAKRIEGAHVLIARAAIARDVIPDALRKHGANVDIVEAYRNVLPDGAPEKLRLILKQGIDAATFTSSSSVTHLREAAEKAGLVFPFAGVPAISIGPITSESLRQQGWEPAAEAKPSDIPGLVSAICGFFFE